MDGHGDGITINNAVLYYKVGLDLVGLTLLEHVRAEVLHVVRHLAELVPTLLLLGQQLFHSPLRKKININLAVWGKEVLKQHTWLFRTQPVCTLYGKLKPVGPVFWIRIRIQHFKNMRSGSRVLRTKNWGKIQVNKIFLFWSKIVIYLSLGLLEQRPSYRRNL